MLFEKRDKAVEEKDKDIFLSTQVEEISYFLSAGYLSQDKLESEVLAIADASKISKAVFVKESYYKNRIKTHEAFLVYYIVDTSRGWKIYRVSNAK